MASVCKDCGRLYTPRNGVTICAQCGAVFDVKLQPTLGAVPRPATGQNLPPPPLQSIKSVIRGKSSSLRWPFGADRTSRIAFAAVAFCAVVLISVAIPLVLSGINRNESVAPQAGAFNDTQHVARSAFATLEQALDKATPIPKPTALFDRTDLIERVDASVVFISVRRAEGIATGSGFVVDENGTICTNRHVIRNSQSITVGFQDNSEVPARAIYIHPQLDIAFVRTIMPTSGPLRAIPLASRLPMKGEDIAAFGSPLGLTFTTSFGNVSAIRDDDNSTFIQFTAPVSPGNSGGPIVNMRGEVVGMTTFGYGNDQSGQNLNFAISSVDITDVFSQFERGIAPQ